MDNDYWQVTEEDELWGKKWLRYEKDGKPIGALIIVVNGTPELIAAIMRAFQETEGMKLK